MLPRGVFRPPPPTGITEIKGPKTGFLEQTEIVMDEHYNKIRLGEAGQQQLAIEWDKPVPCPVKLDGPVDLDAIFPNRNKLKLPSLIVTDADEDEGSEEESEYDYEFEDDNCSMHGTDGSEDEISHDEEMLEDGEEEETEIAPDEMEIIPEDDESPPAEAECTPEDGDESSAKEESAKKEDVGDAPAIVIVKAEETEAGKETEEVKEPTEEKAAALPNDPEPEKPAEEKAVESPNAPELEKPAEEKAPEPEKAPEKAPEPAKAPEKTPEPEKPVEAPPEPKKVTIVEEVKEVEAAVENKVEAGIRALVAGWDPAIRKRIKAIPNGWQLISV